MYHRPPSHHLSNDQMTKDKEYIPHKKQKQNIFNGQLLSI